MVAAIQLETNEGLADLVHGLSAAFAEVQGWPAWASHGGILDETVLRAMRVPSTS